MYSSIVKYCDEEKQRRKQSVNWLFILLQQNDKTFIWFINFLFVVLKTTKQVLFSLRHYVFCPRVEFMNCHKTLFSQRVRLFNFLSTNIILILSMNSGIQDLRFTFLCEKSFTKVFRKSCPLRDIKLFSHFLHRHQSEEI